MRQGDHLAALEAKSIYILREAQANLSRLVMLWSVGKDSTVLLWLVRKAFFGSTPFPLLHIDTSFKIPEMISFRDKLASDWELPLLYARNEAVLAKHQTFPDGVVDRITCCRLLKTAALTRALNGDEIRFRFNPLTKSYEADSDRTPFTGVVVGIRADEEGSRSKERYFSPRSPDGEWIVEEQPPELWDLYNTEFPPGAHVRIHPLLDWTELNIWEYIERERIPVVSLYYDQGNGTRYRSLGCGPCTQPILSNAASARAIVRELRTGHQARVAERAGRAQDGDDNGGLERLRRGGYM